MEINAQAIADRRKQLIAQLNSVTAQEWMIKGQLTELEVMESMLDSGLVDQTEMDKVRDFPTSESR
jgi:hypothetical protein